MWSENDISRYDQDKEPPCRAWQLTPLTPIIPISFLKLPWYHGQQPWCERSCEYLIREITSRPLSLVIGDVSPYSCIRLPHGRFLLPSKSLPDVSYGENVVNKEGDLDQYTVDHDEIVESILKMLSGTSQATLGLCAPPIQTSQYVSYLWIMLQVAAAQYREGSNGEGAASKEDDREDDREDNMEDDWEDDMEHDIDDGIDDDKYGDGEAGTR